MSAIDHPAGSDPPPEQGERQDDQLARALESLSHRAAQGETVDIESEAASLGDLGAELRELWGAVMLANAVGELSPPGPASPGREPAPAAPTLELPCRIGDYELVEEVGRGGMGVVYRAQQLSLGRTVAVKMLLRGAFASAAEQARLKAEAEAAARLQHPNIVPVYEVGEHDGGNFFSMQYIQGETLAALVKSGPLPAKQAATIGAKVARAVDFAHQEGVLHRDLKPSNILIDAAGEPHVMDFGLAKRVSENANLTRTGAVLGTPAYMSPEQAAGNRGEVGVPSDVYSIGTILYQMLAGKPPFEAETPMQLVLKVLEQDPPWPRTNNPQVDRNLELIALRCLQKPPDLRYQSASALADDLDAFLNDEPLAAQSGRFSQVIGQLFRETHNANILEQWGVLWMWHSLALLIICSLTNALYLGGDRNRIHYFLLWTAGLGAWAGVFWAMRRRIGPVTFVERQIAHIWAASMISIAMLFPVEYVMNRPVLELAPVLALSSGMVFLIKAGILSGSFYVQAVVLFATSIVMAYQPRYACFIFGVVSALCFFIPGWKYHRKRLQTQMRERRLDARRALADS